MSVNNFHVFQETCCLCQKQKWEVVFGSAWYVLGPGNVQVKFTVLDNNYFRTPKLIQMALQTDTK